MRARHVALAALVSTFAFIGAPALAAPQRVVVPAPDPLPSWADRGAKKRIIHFVQAVTTQGSPDYVPPIERIAVFDNDGTLWAEKPVYVELAFVIDRVKQMAPQHPEWAEVEPFKGVLQDDLRPVLAMGKKGLLALIMATHAGMSTEEFEATVSKWIATARHPRFDRPYTDLAYQPMLELISYLQRKDFDVYIVSGGGVEFMRPWVEKVYGIQRSHVIGSTIETKLERGKSGLELERKPKIDFIVNGPGKPVAIEKLIGRRPIAAFGNSDGDLQMLEWTTAGAGRRLALLVHHTDAKREWAYDRHAKIGKLDKALDAADQQRWVVVDMKKDWLKIFPFSPQRGAQARR